MPPGFLCCLCSTGFNEMLAGVKIEQAELCTRTQGQPEERSERYEQLNVKVQPRPVSTTRKVLGVFLVCGDIELWEA